MIKDHLKELQKLLGELLEDRNLPGFFDATTRRIVSAFASTNKILVAGNGGSAADAQHFAAEFMGKYKTARRPYPAIALTTDTSFLTAWGNDVAFEGIFSRQVEGLGVSGDIFIGISTSGNSKNIIEAFAAAERAGLFTISLLGAGGGRAKGIASLEYIVPSKDTPRIQEVHMLILHCIAEEVEAQLALGL